MMAGRHHPIRTPYEEAACRTMIQKHLDRRRQFCREIDEEIARLRKMLSDAGFAP